MTTIDRITSKIKKLPEKSQKEVLLFVEFLLSKSGEMGEETEGQLWSRFSLEQAMRGLENDDLPEYTTTDLQEKYSK